MNRAVRVFGIVVLASTFGCHLVFPFNSRVTETDAPSAPDGPTPLTEGGPPLLDGATPISEGPPLPPDAAIPILEGGPVLFDGQPVDVVLPVAGCELTDGQSALISAGCDPAACGTANCIQQALWNGTITQDGTSLQPYCMVCASEHYLSMKRTAGSWDLSSSTGFRFWLYTDAKGPVHWLDSTCHLTPTLFFYDTANRLWTVQRGSKTQPPDPNASLGTWLEVGGPLKQPTSNWYPVGHSQFNFGAVTEIQIRVADAATAAFSVYVDGFTFLGPTPFSQCAGGDPFLAGVAPAPGQGFLELLVGHFEDDAGERYVMVQNMRHKNGDFPINSDVQGTVRLTFDFATAGPKLDKTKLTTLNKATGQLQSLPLGSLGGTKAQVDVPLAAGDPVLFKYATGAPFALQQP